MADEGGSRPAKAAVLGILFKRRHDTKPVSGAVDRARRVGARTPRPGRVGGEVGHERGV